MFSNSTIPRTIGIGRPPGAQPYAYQGGKHIYKKCGEGG